MNSLYADPLEVTDPLKVSEPLEIDPLEIDPRVSGLAVLSYVHLEAEIIVSTSIEPRAADVWFATVGFSI